MIFFSLENLFGRRGICIILTVTGLLLPIIHYPGVSVSLYELTDFMALSDNLNTAVTLISLGLFTQLATKYGSMVLGLGIFFFILYFQGLPYNIEYGLGLYILGLSCLIGLSEFIKTEKNHEIISGVNLDEYR